eukprot:GILI01007090.1.p1 GENE.GILI01007090.1~~GILI01007090.1.p1  ORF type:complete len:205 (-),score=68.69 GILI01007090.1:288-824(-)
MTLNKADVGIILGVALFSSVASEALSWFFVYRTDDYKNLKNKIERQTKELEKLKETLLGAKKKGDKTVTKTEENLKALNQRMQMLKMKSTLLLAVISIALIGFMNSMFEGVVVARLPFVPFSLFTNITHMKLPGEDYTECSATFLYIASSMMIRTNLQKFLGLAPPRGATPNFFEPPK